MNETPADSAAKSEEVPLPTFSSVRSVDSLRKLRTRVKQAASELVRLKEENASLSARIQQLEAMPRLDPDMATVMFEEDPAELHARVQRFIRALDGYLADDPA